MSNALNQTLHIRYRRVLSISCVPVQSCQLYETQTSAIKDRLGQNSRKTHGKVLTIFFILERISRISDKQDNRDQISFLW
jgi:hypothetical protein